MSLKNEIIAACAPDDDDATKLRAQARLEIELARECAPEPWLVRMHQSIASMLYIEAARSEKAAKPMQTRLQDTTAQARYLLDTAPKKWRDLLSRADAKQEPIRTALLATQLLAMAQARISAVNRAIMSGKCGSERTASYNHPAHQSTIQAALMREFESRRKAGKE